MFVRSVRFLSLIRCPSSWSNVPGSLRPGISSCFRGWSSLSVPVAETASDLALNSVVKVFCSSCKFSVLQPWQKRLPEEHAGSGFVISKNRILTNAHVVSDHTFVQVRKHGSPTKYKAKVEAIGHDCDLAILVINSKMFWKDMKPLDLGDVPFQKDTVFVVGYPRGGDNISTTKGVVSRVEVTRYSHSKANLLTVQIDAAINPGNSGGPVLMENKVVGVAFQGLWFSQSTGYIIPTPVVNHFINDVEENNGQSSGFCSLGILYHHMEEACMRNHFKMTSKMTGILIRKINPLSSLYGVLKKDDVLLSIDGVSIANDETVIFRKKDRIKFSHLVSMKKPSETISLKVFRDGEQHKFDVIMKPVEPLIPVHQYDKLPSYYIFAGFVFFPLTQPYMYYSDISDNVLKRMPEKAGEQIIIISQVLEDDINVGSSIFEDKQVEKVNGVKLENLKHLRKLIEECCTKDLRLDLEDDNTIIIDHKSGKKATPKILKRYGIPKAMSKDLQS